MLVQDRIGLAFREVAAKNSEFPAIISEDSIVSYRALWSVVDEFAFRMHEHGVRNGSIVALQTNDMVVSLAVVLAASLLAAEFVVAGPVLAATKTIRPTHFFKTPESNLPRHLDHIVIDENWMVADRAIDSARTDDYLEPCDLQAPWMALHTSGTTGVPKFVTLSQRIVLDRTSAIHQDFPYRATTLATLFGCTSRPFYARAIGALMNGCAIVDSKNPDFWQHTGVNYLCGSPLQSAHFFRDKTFAQKFPKIETSGGKLSDEDAKILIDRFQTVIDIYGASETNKTFATILFETENGQILRKGNPLDSQLEIVDENGAPCADGVVGSVRVRNGYMAKGYIDSPEATAKSFIGGWFYPGDWAMWGANKELVVIGRKDDVISVKGVKFNADLVDMLVRTTPGVADAICFRNPKPEKADEIVIFVQFESVTDREECKEDIRESLSKNFKFGRQFADLHEIDQVPRDENGAPLRDLCRKILLERRSNLMKQRG